MVNVTAENTGGALFEHAVKLNPTGQPPGSDKGHFQAGKEEGQLAYRRLGGL